jgi:uncharacterized protein (DUF924 family)
MQDRRLRAVLDFWFLPPRHPRHGEARKIWFNGGATLDAEIRRRFGPDIERALAGGYRHWTDTPDGTLALCLLLDQFTRNAFRGTARAFAGDRLALRAARCAVARGFDRALPPRLRTFLYLPFEHSEHPGDQHRCIGLFARSGLVVNVRWAVMHRDLVVRFGRFPHRNAALGRADTAAEIAYLAGEHERFGQ